MKRTFVLCLAVLFGIFFVSADAANTRAFSSQPVRAQVQPSTQARQQPPTLKCPPSRPGGATCNKPSRTTCPTVIVYPYPVYYSYPLYSYSVDDSGSSRATYRSNGRLEASDAIASYEISYEDDYWKRGRNWGQDLRRNIVEFDDFAVFVAQQIVSAPESLRLQFRKGFSEGYGQHAEQAFQKAMDLATKERAKAEQKEPAIE